MADQVPNPRNLSKKRPCRCKRKFGDGVGEFILYKGEIRGYVSIGMGLDLLQKQTEKLSSFLENSDFDIRRLPLNHRHTEICVECGALEGVFGKVKLGCLLKE